MGRLTHARSNGIKEGYWSPNKKEELVKRLAEYENTGLSPADVGELRRQQRRYHWIPVEERLPEDNNEEFYDSVIVTLDSGRVAEGCYRKAEKEWLVDAPDGHHFSENQTGHVVAWQPLPEPYGEKKQ